MINTKRRKREQVPFGAHELQYCELEPQYNDADRITVRWTAMAPDPPNYPMIRADNFVPVRFFPFGQQDNVTYDVSELQNLLLHSDLNSKSIFFDDKNVWGNSQQKLRRQDSQTSTSSQARSDQDASSFSTVPTREIFQTWEVAPLWRGMNSGVCLWIRDANEDFVRDCWKNHRAHRRQLYATQNPDVFSSADATNEELELISKYKIKYTRRDETLLLALSSIMCRSFRSVSRLWKRIRCSSSNESDGILSKLQNSHKSSQHLLEDCIVELEEMLISRHLKADPLDGGLQSHFDAFVEQAGQLNPLDPTQIFQLTVAVQRAAERELTYLKRRCKYLLDGRITAEEALQPLDTTSETAAESFISDSERPPRYIPIHRNIFTESAPEPDPEALYGCHCKDGVCSPLACECVIEGGRTYSPEGSLSVNGVGHVVECNHKCTCDPKTCRNRVIQKAVHTVRARYPLQIVKTAKCGFGVVSVLPIPPGQFVCEYFGQIISESEAQRLQKEVYFPLQLNYIWTDSFELPNGESAFSIDSSTHGNISRFVNHSCEPNLFSCRIERQYRDPRVPQVCFFTKRAIRAGEELTLDYNFDASKKEIECKCGKKKCRKWLR